MLVYIGWLHGDGSAGFRARFTDFPGLEVEGPTSAAILEKSRERIVHELVRLDSEGADYPEPASLDEVRASCEASDATVFFIDVPVDDTPIRVNISISERLLKRIDDAVAAQNTTRSGFLASAARLKLGDTLDGSEDGEFRRIYEEVAAIAQRVNDTLGPESLIGRAFTKLDASATEGMQRLAERLAAALSQKASKPQSEPPAPS